MPRVPKLSEAEITAGLSRVPGWKRDGEWLSRVYEFPSFPAAIAFVNRVAGVAEALDHHPDIAIAYTKVTLRVSTHDAGGLTENDFALASRIDA